MRITILDVQAAHFDCFAVALPGRCITAAGDTLLQLWRSLDNRDGALLRRYGSDLQFVCSRRYLSVGFSGKRMAAITPASTRLSSPIRKEERGFLLKPAKALVAYLTWQLPAWRLPVLPTVLYFLLCYCCGCRLELFYVQQAHGCLLVECEWADIEAWRPCHSCDLAEGTTTAVFWCVRSSLLVAAEETRNPIRSKLLLICCNQTQFLDLVVQ